jgi:RNA polymerase sigma-70 factor (ECF subfamily)
MEHYLSHRDSIMRFLIARLGNKADAEDVVQELFLRLSGIEVQQDVRNPTAYVFTMALNIARDYRRGRQRARVRDASWVEAHYDITSGSEAVADIASAEDAYGAKQRVLAVRSALNELSSQCRRVFLLHKFEDLSHAEIALRLGISRSTVEKHMNTALRHLLRRLVRDENTT